MSIDFSNSMDCGFIKKGQQYYLLWNLQKVSAKPDEQLNCIFWPEFLMNTSEVWYCFKNVCALKANDIEDVQHQSNFGEFSCDLKSEFKDFVLKAQNLMGSSGLKKVVPVVAWKSPHIPSWETFCFILKELVENDFSGQWGYGIFLKGQGAIGVTPEILFDSIEKNEFKTMAIAGTYFKGKEFKNSKSKEPLEQFQLDEKENFEHKLVVEDIRLKLSGAESIEVGKIKTIEFGSLVHLFTEISFKMNIDFVDLVKLLHPTSALGVFPKSYFEEWKTYLTIGSKRAHYGAPFGVLFSDAKFSCLVGIRNLEWNKDGSYLGTGCGIVADSCWEKEWQELLEKKEAVVKKLCLI